MFFDAFPRFYETSETGAYRGRLNLRYEAIFAENQDIFAGARVIDIGSHDGRWSLAALKSGATEVIGIEAREDLVAAARENLRQYGSGDGRCEFIAGDVFPVLAQQTFDADVVLCLGYLYHTLRYGELMRRIRDMDPRYLIIDTEVLPRVKRRFVRLRLDHSASQWNAVADSYSYAEKTLVGRPSIPALEFILEAFDLKIERYSDWASLLRDNPELSGANNDYATARRVTARCVSTS
jgi:Methyltransferase domain